MTVTITAFKWVPEFARGFVRDLRPRWACEEIGLAYEERLIGQEEQASASYRAEQPWGQVPVLQDDGVHLFESGAILMHLGEKDERLLPADLEARAHTISWLFAAFNSIEPWVFELGTIMLFAEGEEWAELRKPSLLETLDERLDGLADALGDKDYLVGDFTVADIAMSSALRELERTTLLSERPILAAYVERCTAREGFKKAMADQLAAFDRHEPATTN